MRRSIFSLVAVAAFGVAACLSGCGNSASNKAETKSPKKKTEEPPTTTGSTTCGGSSGLRLTTAPGFDTVKGYLNTNCNSCHPGAGGVKDYKKIEDVKSDAGKILERLKRDKSAGGFMPPGGMPDSGEIAKLQAWLAGGFQAEAPIVGSTSTGGGTATTGSAGGSSTDCGGGASTTTTGGSGTTTGGMTVGGTTSQSTAADPDPAFFDPIINPAKKDVCHQQKKPFQHSASEGGGDCIADYRLLDKTVDGFECTRDGIVTKYGNDAQVSGALDPLVTAGKTFQDCGIATDGKHLKVFMLCLSDQAGDTPPNCVSLEKLDGKEVHPKPSAITLPYPP